MKRKAFFIALLPVFLLVSPVFCDSRGNVPRQGPQRTGPAGSPGRDSVKARDDGRDNEMQLARELGLTREQKEMFREQMREVREQMVKLNAMRDKARRKYEELMASNNPDEEAVLSALDEVHKVNVDIARLRVRSKRSVNEVLEPEQLKRLGELRENLRERRRSQNEWRRRPVRRHQPGPENGDGRARHPEK